MEELQTLPASHATAVLRRGTLRATRIQSGKNLGSPIPFYGSTANSLRLLHRLKFSVLVAGPGTSVLWCVKRLVFFFFWRIHCVGSSAVIGDVDGTRKVGFAFASLAFFYCDLKEDERRTCAGYSRPSWSSFVINLTPTMMFSPSSTLNMPMVRVIQRRSTCRVFKGPSTQTAQIFPRLLNRGRVG